MTITEITAVPPGYHYEPEMVELKEIPPGQVFKHVNKFFLVLDPSPGIFKLGQVIVYDIQSVLVTSFLEYMLVQKCDTVVVATPMVSRVTPPEDFG